MDGKALVELFEAFKHYRECSAKVQESAGNLCDNYEHDMFVNQLREIDDIELNEFMGRLELIIKPADS